MTLLRRIVKFLLPFRFRMFLRRVHRGIVFRRAMKRFLAAPHDTTRPGHPVLLDLVYGWGNESWSARDEYLAECIDRALASEGPILECGSGLSTILIGAVAKQRGQAHWALEHLPQWAAKVQRHLDRYHLDSVTLCSAPLKDYGNFFWYDAPLDSMPAMYSLVICDGPPGGTEGGRYGLVPVMGQRLTPGCIILLDDVVRIQEHTIARRWSAELGADLVTRGDRKPFIKLTVPDRHVQQLAQGGAPAIPPLFEPRDFAGPGFRLSPE